MDYFVVNVQNPDGTVKAEREMTKAEWEEYLHHMQELKKNMYAQKKCENRDSYEMTAKRQVNLPLQVANEFTRISYCSSRYLSDKTIATSGNFPLTIKSVLEAFGKSVALEDLICIAKWGDWITPDGRTYWHFIDATCYAYGLKCARISTMDQIKECLENNGVVLALISKDLFQNGLGNRLSTVIKVVSSKIFIRSTSTAYTEVLVWGDFFNGSEAIWAINV